MIRRLPVLGLFFGVFLGAGVDYREPQAADAAVDPRELRSLALDLLGRPPLRAEWLRWQAKSRAELVDELLGSAEFWSNWYEEQLYYFLLVNNFRPEQPRVTAIPGELHARRLHVREALHRIALSASFDQRNPGADTFVTVVLEQLAGLDITRSQRDLEIGKKLYDGAPGSFLGQPGQGQAGVVGNAVACRTFAAHFLRREYERLLRSRPDAGQLAAWAARFEKDPACHPALVREWLLGPAYDTRLARPVLLANRTFVRALFVDLADRLPLPGEAEPMREALDGLADSAPLRSITARMLLDSGKLGLPSRQELGDASVWLRSIFPRLLGRAASAPELAEFAQVLAEPQARVETVLYALVSSAEYSRY